MRQNPKVNDTRKLAGLLPLSVGMAMILTQTYLPPFIFRGTAVLAHDIQLHPSENLSEHLRSMNRDGLVILQFMPLAVCVRVKDSTQNIVQGDEINEDDATNLRGILAVEPVTRLWKHKIKDGRKVTAVHRTQIPLLH